MLLSASLPYYGFRVNNLPSAPAVSMGATITAGAANTLGSWVEVLTAAQLTQDLVGLHLNVNTLSSAGATNRSAGVEIGIDPAGGTSYTTIISGISVGGVASNLIGLGAGRQFYFPYRIPSGASVAVRGQAAVASATMRVLAFGYGAPSGPETFFEGQYSETIGWQSAGSQGTTFTPGNATWGSWASIGTTTQPLRWLQYCTGSSDTSMTAIYTHVEVAFGDGTNKHKIADISLAHSTAEFQSDSLLANSIPACAMVQLPAGATIYARGWCNTTPDGNYNLAVVGIG